MDQLQQCKFNIGDEKDDQVLSIELVNSDSTALKFICNVRCQNLLVDE